MQKHKAIQHFNWLRLLLSFVTFSKFIANELVSQDLAEERHFQRRHYAEVIFNVRKKEKVLAP